MKNFTNQYQLSKTLRFELIPQDGVRNYIEKLQLAKVEGQSKTLLEADIYRKEQRDKYKLLIDDFHKWFIDKSLVEFSQSVTDEFKENLKVHYNQFLSKNKFDKQKIFIAELTSYFKRADEVSVEKKMKNFMLPDKDNQYCIIKEWFESEEYKNSERNFDEDKKTINSFSSFFTYLKDYNDIRKNLYKPDGKAGTIGNRLFYKNLNLFCYNIKHYNDLPPELKEIINQEWEKSDIFHIENYMQFLTQSQINWFNQMIGNKPVELGNRQPKGLNALINEYNQKKKKKEKLKFFKKLQNQILFREKDNSYNRKVNTNDDVKSILNELVFNQNFLEIIQNQIALINNESFEGIFISKRNIPKLSKYIFSGKIDESHFVIKEGLKLLAEQIIEKTKTTTNKKGEEVKKAKTEAQIQKEINEFLKQEYFSLEQIEEAIKLKIESNNDFKNFTLLTFLKELKPIISHDVLDKDENILTKNEIFEIANQFEIETNKIKSLINNDTINWEIPLFKNEHKKSELKPVEKIKNYLDTLLKIAQFSLIFKVDAETLDKGDLDIDADFYNQYDNISDVAFKIINAHKEIAAFVSQKEYDNSKTLVRFDRSNNIGGWTESVTDNSKNFTQYGGYLFRRKRQDKQYDFYLGISKRANLFKCIEKKRVSDKSEFERLEYYQIDTKSFYNTQYQNYEQFKKEFNEYFEKLINDFDDNKLLEKIRKKKEEEKNPLFYFSTIRKESNQLFELMIKDEKFIDFNTAFINECIRAMKNLRRISLDKESMNIDNYNYFDELMSILEQQLNKHKSFSYFSISQSELENVNINANDDNFKPFLLFKIQNKDLKYLPNKKNQNANKNLHTLYFEELMKGNQTTFDLGSGEVFFRKSSVKHDDHVMKNGHHYNDEKNLKDKFKDQYSKYENSRIISNKRFITDKYFLHLSINLNYTADTDSKKYKLETLNEETLKFLQQNPDFKIIGIDRGERHLLYCSVINSEGFIEKQFSLNIIDNENFKSTNYIEKLDNRQKERIKSRQNWDTVNKIKDLKAGYLSQAVHKIVTIMESNDFKTIVIMEDLNAGFKKERSSIEKSVYQQFENALISKLTFIIDKKDTNSLHNALQLTKPELVSNLDKTKQNGFIFYIPAAYTSKIDPTTGFMHLPYAVNLTFESVNKTKLLFQNQIKNFKYNIDKDYFQFDINLKHKTKVEKKEIEVMDKEYTICSHGEAIRYYYSEKEKINKPLHITERLKTLFEKHQINWKNGSIIESEIIEVSNDSFYKELLYLLRVLLTLRHTDSNGNDNIISPVLNKYNKFYNSSEYKEYDIILPENADANGAFHIALKGKFLIDRILTKGFENIKEVDYKYSNLDWYNNLNKFH